MNPDRPASTSRTRRRRLFLLAAQVLSVRRPRARACTVARSGWDLCLLCPHPRRCPTRTLRPTRSGPGHHPHLRRRRQPADRAGERAPRSGAAVLHPRPLIDAVIATEDRRFFEHWGLICGALGGAERKPAPRLAGAGRLDDHAAGRWRHFCRRSGRSPQGSARPSSPGG